MGQGWVVPWVADSSGSEVGSQATRSEDKENKRRKPKATSPTPYLCVT